MIFLVLSLGLVVLGLGTVISVVALFTGHLTQRVRARRHTGTYRVRIGSASGRGRAGFDVDGELRSIAEAREYARSELVAVASDDELDKTADEVAFILAARGDGGWDVVDRIDAL